MSDEEQVERRDARERLPRRLLRLLTTPLFGPKERTNLFSRDIELVRLVVELPPALAESLLDLLLDLRAERITPAELWSRWGTLPVGEPNQLAALRDFLKSWLYWREHGMRPGIASWTQEAPERTSRRTLLNLIIELLERKYRPSEVAAVPAPDGHGDEASPAESAA